MPPAVEPKGEQVVAAIVAALASMAAGPEFFHSTERAVRGPYFHKAHMDTTLDPARASYVVSRDDVEEESDSFTDIKAVLQLDVTAFKRFTPSSEGPYDADEPLRDQVQARLEADVKNKLRADEGLAAATGVNVLRVWIPFVRYAADETFYQGWAVVRLRVVVEYVFDRVAA